MTDHLRTHDHPTHDHPTHDRLGDDDPLADEVTADQVTRGHLTADHPTHDHRSVGLTASDRPSAKAADSASAGSAARPRRRARRLVAAVLVGGLVALAGYALDPSTHEAAALGPGLVTVHVTIEHSRFDLGTLRVREGTLVRFVVHNADPIDHELVIGDAEVHRRHTVGDEQRHPPVPGEVSVAPGATALTFYQFDAAGTVVYACHLPGHIAYGMRGEIEVIAATNT